MRAGDWRRIALITALTAATAVSGGFVTSLTAAGATPQAAPADSASPTGSPSLTDSPTPTPSATATATATATPTPIATPIPTAVTTTTAAKQAATPPGPPLALDPKPSAHPTLASGFGDPPSPNGPTQWKVRDRHVRLLSRLVANQSNVADAVVRKAVEWDAWQYLQCYERAFGGAKDLEEGTVTVAFDILDQLPRHAQLQGSTFRSKTFDDCVVGTLVGQTINAAGPDGKGHVVYAFRFVPN